MAILLQRPPTRPQFVEERPSEAPIMPAHDVETTSFEHWWQQLSVHDQIAALLLTIGEYGALAHGAAWATLLGLLEEHGKHAELPEAHDAAHSGLVH